MSEQPHEAEQRSSVEIARNAKGEAQPRVKVYAGTTAEEMDRIRQVAVDQFKQLASDLAR